MEVKINREIRNYTESIFFGLSLRQFVFSILACGVAVLLYFLLKGHFGIETLSWVCILGAAPFAAIGFVTYNGMTAEKFLYAYIKSEFLIPKNLTFKPVNFYYELLKDKLEQLANSIKSSDEYANFKEAVNKVSTDLTSTISEIKTKIQDKDFDAVKKLDDAMDDIEDELDIIIEDLKD